MAKAKRASSSRARARARAPHFFRALALTLRAPAATKHTAAECAAKAHASTVNKGGGAAGLADRKGGGAGHSRFKCSHCGTPVTSLVQARAHHDARHEKLPWKETDYEDVHEAAGGVTTVGIAVRGTTNAEKLRAKGAS